MRSRRVCVRRGVLAPIVAADGQGLGWAWLPLLLIPLGIAAVHPAILGRILTFGRRATKGRLTLEPQPWGSMLGLIAWSIPTWLFLGGASVAVTSALGYDQRACASRLCRDRWVDTWVPRGAGTGRSRAAGARVRRALRSGQRPGDGGRGYRPAPAHRGRRHRRCGAGSGTPVSTTQRHWQGPIPKPDEEADMDRGERLASRQDRVRRAARGRPAMRSLAWASSAHSRPLVTNDSSTGRTASPEFTTRWRSPSWTCRGGPTGRSMSSRRGSASSRAADPGVRVRLGCQHAVVGQAVRTRCTPSSTTGGFGEHIAPTVMGVTATSISVSSSRPLRPQPAVPSAKERPRRSRLRRLRRDDRQGRR